MMISDQSALFLDYNSTQYTTIVRPYEHPILTFYGKDGNFLVKSHPNGRIEYGPNYTPDEAAKVFWESIGSKR